jgi:hypothetical protein
MTDGRTVWLAKDSAWWRRERIVELGERFGPAGPAVVDWLACEAKAQNDGGEVKAGYRTLARGCFLKDAKDAQRIVEFAVEIGALDELKESGKRTFTCRVSGWHSEQERARSAERQAAWRGRGVTDRYGVTGHNAASRAAEKCPPTGQDRTVNSSLSSTSEPSARASVERGEREEVS